MVNQQHRAAKFVDYIGAIPQKYPDRLAILIVAQHPPVYRIKHNQINDSDVNPDGPSIAASIRMPIWTCRLTRSVGLTRLTICNPPPQSMALTCQIRHCTTGHRTPGPVTAPGGDPQGPIQG